jgi:hypothetical protein
MVHQTLLTSAGNAAALQKKDSVHNEKVVRVGEDAPGQDIKEPVQTLPTTKTRGRCFWGSPRETCLMWHSPRSREPSKNIEQGSKNYKRKGDGVAQKVRGSVADGVRNAGKGVCAKPDASGVPAAIRDASFTSVPGTLRKDSTRDSNDLQSASSEGWWTPLFDPTSWMKGCWAPQSGIDSSAFELVEYERAQKNLLGSIASKIFASYDSSVLGVETGIGSMKLSPMQGRMEIWNLTVDNPDGYHSPHLLQASRAKIEIDMKKLLLSKGREIVVQEIVFEGVHVIYEKALSTSNLNDLLNRIVKPRVEQQFNAEDLIISVRKVTVRDIELKLATVITGDVCAHFEVSDITYENFAEEIGESGRCLTDIVSILIITFIKSVLTVLFGKKVAKHVVGTLADAHNGLRERMISGVGVTKQAVTDVVGHSSPRSCDEYWNSAL